MAVSAEYTWFFNISLYRKRHNRKTVIAAHSMGATVCHNSLVLPHGWLIGPRSRWSISSFRTVSDVVTPDHTFW